MRATAMTGVTSSNYQATPRRIGRAIIAVSSALAAATMFASLAQAQSRQDLWVERNGWPQGRRLPLQDRAGDLVLRQCRLHV
ncbi:MAG: hypothetical protein MZV49_03215 [Rhodopseudomonas palustris]|nr:hypothetical protein [Rhodopseudomonas palustris]